MEGGTTKRVQARLNAGRAMTLCCTANRASSRVSMMRAGTMGPGTPLLIVFGTGRSPTKAMA
jgi:hypothetical protein